MNAYAAICIIITAVKKPTIKMNCPEKNIVYISVFGKKNASYLIRPTTHFSVSAFYRQHNCRCK